MWCGEEDERYRARVSVPASNTSDAPRGVSEVGPRCLAVPGMVSQSRQRYLSHQGIHGGLRSPWRTKTRAPWTVSAAAVVASPAIARVVRMIVIVTDVSADYFGMNVVRDAKDSAGCCR